MEYMLQLLGIVLIYSEAWRKLLRRFEIGLLWSLNIKIKQSQKQTNKKLSV